MSTRSSAAPASEEAMRTPLVTEITNLSAHRAIHPVLGRAADQSQSFRPLTRPVAQPTAGLRPRPLGEAKN
jgi:hypothetical protein